MCRTPLRLAHAKCCASLCLPTTSSHAPRHSTTRCVHVLTHSTRTAPQLTQLWFWFCHQVVYRLARWLAALVGVLAQDPAHRPVSAQPSSRASVASSEHAPSARPSNAAASVASASTKASSTYIISERGAVPLKPAAPPFRRFSSPGAPVALQVPRHPGCT